MNLEEKKALVLKALHEAFNLRDLTAYDRYWSPDYIQHSAILPPGVDDLKKEMIALPESFRYEPGLIVADGDHVMVHGKYSGFASRSWIIVDIFRIENDLLAEHWDVIQDEVSKSESKSGAPMFGNVFSN